MNLLIIFEFVVPQLEPFIMRSTIFRHAVLVASMVMSKILFPSSYATSDSYELIDNDIFLLGISTR